MFKRINCKSFIHGGYCSDKRIKRTLGIFARCCKEYNDKSCELKNPFPRPKAPPPSPDTSSDIVVITVEGGVVQYVESKKPLDYLIVDINGNDITSYLETTKGNPEEIQRCLKEHKQRN